MKLAILANLAASAAAFAPFKVAQTSTTLNVFEDALGLVGTTIRLHVLNLPTFTLPNLTAMKKKMK